MTSLWVAKALEGEAKARGGVKDVTIQGEGSCNNDATCRANCPGCAVTQCLFQQCVCDQCSPKLNLRVRSEKISGEMRDATTQRGEQTCDDDNTCRKNCPDCKVAVCYLRQCICTRCSFPTRLPNLLV
ncbi:unnamed protein product [Thlaspi arvense]|uniref:Uncharacterized protein n=1 Tax=Thlaspi arvense TaxID=13288 RepID=A0AAU9RB27_THLAR|nr:unnamed protein product [Thlaspi arvense]